MKNLMGFILITTCLMADNGTGSYELKMSSKQSIINLYAASEGYANISMTKNCGVMQLLNNNNKKITSGTGILPINYPVKKGKYKLVVIPSLNDCTINILMPE